MVRLERASDIDHVVCALRVPDQDERPVLALGTLPQDVVNRRRPMQVSSHLGLDAVCSKLVGEAVHAGREHAEPAAQ